MRHARGLLTPETQKTHHLFLGKAIHIENTRCPVT